MHTAWCQSKNRVHSDAAKRVSDTFNLHRIGAPYDSIGKYFACRLTDGTSDNTLYDSRRECIRHQKHNEQFYTFVRIGPYTMNACEAEVMLKTARAAYDRGMRLADPADRHGGKELIKRLTVSDQLALARGAVTGLILPGYEKN